MRIPFSLVFLGLILAEIAGFVLVGRAVGVLGTLGLVLMGMAAGVLLLRRQGVATLMKVRDDLDAGRPPARPLAEGALLAFAAILIILPGFITDIAGILLFVPFVRAALWRAVRRRVTIRTATMRPSPQGGAGPVVDLGRDDYRRRPDSPWRLGRGSES